jgi:hypothetical protein
MKRAKRIFVMADTHFCPPGVDDLNGGHDEAAFKTALKAIEVIRPDEFIHVGDVGEWASVSAWEFKIRKKPPLAYLLKDLDKEVAWNNKMMDRIDAALDKVGCKKRTLIEGNHETRIRRMLADYSLALEIYAPEKVLKLRQRGWSFVPFGQFLRRGKLRLYHGGHFSTVHHAYNTALKSGCSVMYGDRHDIQSVTVPSIEGAHAGFCIGCLCKLSKDFLQGRKVNWQHGFAVVLLRPNGKFLAEIHRIQDGWACVEGREIQDGKLVAGRPRKEII